MGRLTSCLAVCLCCALASCDSAETETKGAVGDDHVWKSQVQAIDRARDVEGVLRNSTRRQQEPTE